ncbi:hypothetical protein [Paraburkholderia youngii]|uniref:Uncharacterized protein n=1 Tax=Paraburkholderia youngii TaxID=2782701 RepID=A0A7Y6MXN2_9BURK|nr:hypothetical protein [Paraburkholderia youngii]NUX99926.1 hypothetical protein [Paraburkholderia youngii]
MRVSKRRNSGASAARPRERDDSPWYPHTLRLFRRAPGEDWASSVERVRQACVERFGGAL